MAEMVAEHGLAGGAHSQALFQRVAAAGGDPGNLGGKAVDQLALFLQQAFGDQHGHSHVLVAGSLKTAVQVLLDVLPDGVAIGAQHHKALYAGVLDQFGLGADVSIPLGKVDLLCGDRFNHFFLIVCHYSISSHNFKTIGIGGHAPTMPIHLEQKSAFLCRQARKCAFLRRGESKGGVQERGAATSDEPLL